MKSNIPTGCIVPAVSFIIAAFILCLWSCNPERQLQKSVDRVERYKKILGITPCQDNKPFFIIPDAWNQSEDSTRIDRLWTDTIVPVYN